MKKLLIGIIVSVIAGLIVWVVTQPGDKDFSFAPKPSPILQIVDVQHTESVIKLGDKATIKVAVFNSGDGVAKKCAVYWHIYEEEYTTSDPDQELIFYSLEDLFRLEKERKIEKTALASTEWFPLMPGESREVSVVYTFPKKALYITAISLFSETIQDDVWIDETYMVAIY